MISLSLSDKVMLGTALLGGMAGVVGSFAVLRGRALVGDMLAHAALPGVCLAFLITGHRDLLGLSVGALISGLLAITAVTIITRWTRTKEDAAIGIVLSTFFGAGVVLLSIIQKPSTGGNKAGLNSYLFGEPGGMLNSDLIVLAVVGAIVLGVVALFFKEFELTCFDSDFARTQGWPTVWLDLAMLAMLAMVTIVGLPIVGVILMAAMIIVPAATARFWTNRLPVLLVVSGMVGATAGLLGTQVGRGYPAGAVIVVTASAMFVVSLLFAPHRGIVSKLLSEYRLRRRIAEEHLLRALFELSEAELPAVLVINLQTLRDYRHWWSLDRLLERAREEQLIEWDNKNNVQLTPLGLKRAAQITKAHRLWELYLVRHADIAPDHVDRDADDVEHLLPESLVAKLEQELAAEGRLPTVLAEVPHSPHEISADSSGKVSP
jgi:manganese/zinc/iron transport system permease protein